MAEGLDRDIELLEIQEVSAWRQQLGAAAAGLLDREPPRELPLPLGGREE